MSFLTKLIRSREIQTSLDPLTEKALSQIASEVASLRAVLEQTVRNFESTIALSEQRSIAASGSQQIELEQKVSAYFENRLISLNEALVRHIELNSEATAQATAQATAATSREITKLRREIDALRVPFTNSANISSPAAEKTVQPVDPTIYAAIEEHFRGSQETISKRQRSYLPFLEKAKQDNLPILDLGCGRGEWLEILKSEGFACEGIDTNQVFLSECAEKGLNTTNIDLLSFLSSQNSPRFGAITLFQVAEHLPFNVLVEVFRAARKCLVPGGVFIVETPNAKNLRVGAGTFWIDPTHERPLFPELLEFLSQLVGFESYETQYSASNVDLYEFSDAPPHTRVIIEILTLAVDGPADYALIAMA
jgi:2-polyprenyl-3-methyl-5-hydroxy-6-metoxy-1,4-benzoquinol methylase